MTSGGAKHPEFEGISVLVVDDDYYQATDAADAFAKVGATVIGPCGHVDQALASIESTAIDCAVVDLNLGLGASFDVPRCLKNRGIPLLIVTGYDESMLPPDLKGTSWLDKPVHRTALVRTMALSATRVRRAEDRAPWSNLTASFQPFDVPPRATHPRRPRLRYRQ